MIVTFEETYQNCQTIINKEEQNMITLKGKDPKMIANNLKPFKPTHPGEVLKDELEFRGISQRGLAKKMDISYSALNEVLNGKRALNPELAMMMEAALGVDAAPLLAMQNEYDMQMAERNETFMEKLKHLRRIAAIFWYVVNYPPQILGGLRECLVCSEEVVDVFDQTLDLLLITLQHRVFPYTLKRMLFQDSVLKKAIFYQT